MHEEIIEQLKDPEIQESLKRLPTEDLIAFKWHMSWLANAHDHQIVPAGEWWNIWLLLAGRGAGKTRTASETIGRWAWELPNSRWLCAGPTSSDVRGTMFEGDSGLLNVIPQELIKDYNKSFHELILTNGSLIKGIPASEPERFRGGQWHGAWCLPKDTMISLPDGLAKPIQDVKVGDMVLTRHGARKVLASCVSGNTNELVRIASGVTSLTLTSDHPILVGEEWVPSGNIKKGDQIWLATSEKVANISTDLSMSKPLVQFLRDGLSIIRMRTSTTTTSATLRQCQKESTSPIIQREEKVQTHKKELPLLRWLICVKKSLESVFNVAQSLLLPQYIMYQSSAQAIVRKFGGQIGSCQSNEPVRFAPRSTQPLSHSKSTVQSNATQSQQKEHIVQTQVEVKSVERLPNSLTYNLTVEGEHEFIANHVVVHNCDELAAWDYIQEAWDQIQFSVRLGTKTRIICTTTPRPKDLIVDLVGRDGDDVIVTTASTYTNLDNLAPSFKKQILQYEGTKLGKQEIYAEILDPEDTGIIKRSMFRLWPNGKPFPKFEYILQSYDCATSEKFVNDATASITLGVFKPTDGPMSAMVIDCWQDRLQYPDLRPKVKEEYEIVFGEGKDKKRVDLILVEDKSAGIQLIQDLQRAHLPVRAYNPGRIDKVQRLNVISPVIVHGRVWVPESSKNKGFVRDWAEGMVSQVCSFPESAHDDYVDALTQALRFLRDTGWLDVDGPRPDDYDEEDYVDSGMARTKGNPYAQ